MRLPLTKNYFLTILFFIFTISVEKITCESVGCVHRDYGKGGTVCVCNATYCDTIEPLATFPPRQYYLITSTRDGQRFNVKKRNFSSQLKKRGVFIKVNASITFQTIYGFGGAITDSAAINAFDLSEGSRNNLISSYYSRNGIEYDFMRVPIAGTDFSERKYTYNDEAQDAQLKHFQLSQEDTDFKIPFIKKSIELSKRKVKLLGAAWTAPPWMKTNNDYSGFGFLREEYYGPWSDYHIRFLAEYEKHGLRFWGISTGNEPINGLIPFFHFNCMGWTPMAQRKWISEYIGPALERSRFNGTLIFALDDQRFQLPWWLNLLLEDGTANKYVAGVGVHWYWDNYVPALILDRTHRAFPDKIILPTEACFVKKFWEKQIVELGSWSRGEQYAESVIDDINHWGAGWIDWNLALDETGGPNWAKNFADAAVIVNKTGDEFYKQPMYYALGHFSKFIPEGSVRIQLEVQSSRVKAVAVKTPEDHVVIVLINKKSVEVPVSISGAPRGHANFAVPAKSITTLIYRDKKFPSWLL